MLFASAKSQTVDKTNEFRQFTESFGQRACAFDFPQKLAQWRARSPPRPPQRAKTSSAFLFCELFSLRLWCQRKKWLTSLCNQTICLPLVYTLRTTNGRPYMITS